MVADPTIETSPTDAAAIEVAMIADLACPWCHVGMVRLDRAREMRPELPVSLRWWPFFLNPSMPSDGMDRASYLRAKFGGEEAARRIYRRIVEAGEAEGIPFAFERMPRTPNTLLAHRLVLLAETQGIGETMVRVLFRALFEDGRDVGRRDELLALAEQAGLERETTAAFLDGDQGAAEVIAYHQRAHQLGVQGVPVFVAGGEDAIAGAQPAEVLVGLLDAARAKAEDRSADQPGPVAATAGL